jgi:hypothetical protein
MICPNCGRETPPEAAYCPNCGAAIEAGVRWDPPGETEPIARSGATPSPSATAPPAPSGRRPAWNPLAAWSTALVRAAVAFVVVVVVVLLNAILVRQLSDAAVEELPLPPGLELEALEVPFTETIKGGLLQFHAAHVVPLVVEVRDLTVPGTAGVIPPDARFDASLTFTPMLFTALASVLLFVGGRAVARRAGGGPVSRGLSGATVAVPYALLSLLLSLLVSSSMGFEQFLAGVQLPLPVDLDLKVHAGYVAAFLWPLAIGAVAGFLGGLATAREDLAARRPWGSRAWSALAGGWRMLAVGLLGSFLGLQVVAFAESDLPIPYGPGFFAIPFEESTSTGLLFTDQTVTLLPNMAVWVLVPSMGACDGVDLDAFVFRLDVDVICYGSFPGPGAEDAMRNAPAPPNGGFPQVPDLPAAPSVYLLFLLVPAVATGYGGWAAARRSGLPRASEGALAGVGAGVVFALGTLALAVVSRATLSVTGSAGGISGEGGLSAGADPVLGTLLALAWGLAGGAIGGLLGARSLPPEAREPVAAAPTSAPGAAPGWPWAGPPPPGNAPTFS